MEDFMSASSNSGAELRLILNDSPLVEKKYTGDLERARRDIAKQMNFVGVEGVNIVPIIKCFDSNNELKVHMPYVEGVSGERFVLHGNKSAANNIREKLNRYFISLYAEAVEVVYPSLNIETKISEILSKSIIGEVQECAEALAQNIRLQLDGDLIVPMSRCHGDLTLSNIIFKQDDLYLLDFLSCDIESPLQDAAKILQDVYFGWSFRRSSDVYKLSGRIFCEKIKPELISVFERMYKKEMKVILSLTILRISPYIVDGDKETIFWFQNAVNKICEGL